MEEGEEGEEKIHGLHNDRKIFHLPQNILSSFAGWLVCLAVENSGFMIINDQNKTNKRKRRRRKGRKMSRRRKMRSITQGS